MPTEKTQTVWTATYDLLRSLKLTTIFGNPGSTEQPFLKNFPPPLNTFLASKRPLLLGWRMDSPKPRADPRW
jgi:hypothetical protein